MAQGRHVRKAWVRRGGTEGHVFMSKYGEGKKAGMRGEGKGGQAEGHGMAPLQFDTRILEPLKIEPRQRHRQRYMRVTDIENEVYCYRGWGGSTAGTCLQSLYGAPQDSYSYAEYYWNFTPVIARYALMYTPPRQQVITERGGVCGVCVRR